MTTVTTVLQVSGDDVSPDDTPSTAHQSGGLTPDEELLCACGSELAGGDPERVRRIAAELATAFAAMAAVTGAVSVFGSARTPASATEHALARQVASVLGRRGFSIITGGGPGLMEAASRGAQDAGATSIGLTIELPQEQATNRYVDVEVPFRYFFARKLAFVRYASAFVVLPGGFGTLDELFEALTLIQTGKISHFPVVLVGSDYWAGLLDWLETQAVEPGRVERTDLDILQVTDDPDRVCEIVVAGHAAQLATRAARS